MITFNEGQTKLGDIKLNEETKFDIEVTATEKTFIKHLKVSCGCTVPELSRNPVLPESPSILHVKFTPRSTGHNQKTIWLGFEEGGENKEAMISFSATVT